MPTRLAQSAIARLPDRYSPLAHSRSLMAANCVRIRMARFVIAAVPSGEEEKGDLEFLASLGLAPVCVSQVAYGETRRRLQIKTPQRKVEAGPWKDVDLDADSEEEEDLPVKEEESEPEYEATSESEDRIFGIFSSKKKSVRPSINKHPNKKMSDAKVVHVCLMCKSRRQSKSQRSLTWGLICHATGHIDRKQFGVRYHCNDCDFKTPNVQQVRLHKREKQHTFLDRGNEVDGGEFLLETERVLQKCYPEVRAHDLSSRCKVVRRLQGVVEEVEETTAQGIQCQYCMKQLNLKTEKSHIHLMFDHSCNHIGPEHGARMHCKDCDYSCNGHSSMFCHTQKLAHRPIDLCKYSVRPQFVRESARVFAMCFPTMPIPDTLASQLEMIQHLKSTDSNAAALHPNERRMIDEEERLTALGRIHCTQCEYSVDSQSKNGKLFEHVTAYHVAGELRYHCLHCEDQTNMRHCVDKHQKATGHEMIDRCKNTEELEYLTACASSFSLCFPSERPPPSFTRVKRVSEKGAHAKRECATIKQEREERKDECQKCALILRTEQDFFRHSVVHLPEGLPTRFSCTQCDFHTNQFKARYKHKIEFGHKTIDRAKDATNPEYIAACALVFSECFPSQKRPAFLEAALRLHVKKEEDRENTDTCTCQMCGKELTAPAGLGHHHKVFIHACFHIDEAQHGCRFHCTQCDMKTNRFNSMQAHAVKCKAAFVDHAFDGNNKEMILECVRLLSVCFPGREPPQKLVRAVQRVHPKHPALKGWIDAYREKKRKAAQASHAAMKKRKLQRK